MLDHIEDGHTDGNHGKPSNFAKVVASLALIGGVLEVGHIAISAVRERLLNKEAAEAEQKLQEASNGTEIGEVADKLRFAINKCNSAYSVCENAAHESRAEWETGRESKTEDEGLRAITNAPHYAKCAEIRLNCLKSIE